MPFRVINIVFMVKKGMIIRILAYLLFTGTLFAQDNVNDERNFYNANLLTLYHKYEEALPIYLRLLEKHPDNSNLQYLTGTCYLHIPGQKTRAIPYLEKASENISKRYQKELYEEKRAPLEAILFLGRAYQINNQLDKALSAYGRYKKMVRKTQKEILADRWISSCELAKKMMSHPADADIVFPELLKTGPVVYHPVISGDGKKMAFMSDTRYYHAIYFTESEHGAWTAPYNITMDIESDGSYRVSSLNYDGTMLFLVVPKKEHRDIYLSRYKEGRWGKATPLRGKINTLRDEVFASLSPDGQTLYFVSDRSGGPGGLDIFTATRSSNGEWDHVTPLPGPVNTPFDEQSPLLSPDGKKLFFSSDGHATMGGFDIFVSRYANGTWGNPENAGYPLNTTDDDLYFAPLEDGYRGYFTRWFNGKEKKAAIAAIEFFSSEHPRPVTLSGKLVLPPGRTLPDSLQVIITNIRGEEPASSTHVTPEGLFDTKLPAGTYRINISGRGITPYSGEVTLTSDKKTESIEIPLTFTSPPKEKEEKKETFIISPVYFDFNKYALTAAARTQLDRLAEILKALPGVTVTIEGHTDAIGSAAYNKKLSLKRAAAVKEYLVSKGISSTRLTTTGYGESRPVAINRNPDGTDNPQGRKYNRRASFRLKGNGAVRIRVKADIPPALLLNK